MDEIDEYIYNNYKEYKYLYQIDSTIIDKVMSHYHNTTPNEYILQLILQYNISLETATAMYSWICIAGVDIVDAYTLAIRDIKNMDDISQLRKELRLFINDFEEDLKTYAN